MDRTITIVMALYKPNLEWLKEELVSIRNQTFPDICLLAWNDCPEDHFDYETFFARYLGGIDYKIYHGPKNMGSNKVFEKLTSLVTTPYIAYCDQDDVWMPEKLATLLFHMTAYSLDLVFSDMYVIDGESRQVASSITQVRRHHVFHKGPDFFSALIRKNCVAGCTVLMRTAMAQKAIPFPDELYHDWWLAVYAAAYGRVGFINKPLIRYRIYGGNQTGTLKNINSKQDYYQRRIVQNKLALEAVKRRMTSEDKIGCVTKCIEWMDCREKYFISPTICNLWRLWVHRNMGRGVTLFEMLLPFLPSKIFEGIVNNIQKNRL